MCHADKRLPHVNRVTTSRHTQENAVTAVAGVAVAGTKCCQLGDMLCSQLFVHDKAAHGQNDTAAGLQILQAVIRLDLNATDAAAVVPYQCRHPVVTADAGARFSHTLHHYIHEHLAAIVTRVRGQVPPRYRRHPGGKRPGTLIAGVLQGLPR